VFHPLEVKAIVELIELQGGRPECTIAIARRVR
jgi:hypothetical protein